MATKVNLKEKKILVIDNGLFNEFALKLADFFGKVYYYVEWKDAYPGMAKAIIGTEWVNGKRLDTFDGKNFERVENLYDYIDKVDGVFFPDVYDGDMQEFLLDKGIPVAGGMKGEELELERWHTKQYFRKVGMDVQPVQRIVGLENLKTYLKDKKNQNKWVKISKFRRQFETFHHEEYELTEPLLKKIDHELGPLAEIVEFVVEDHIDALVEEGMDGYTVDGKFPNYTFAGAEIKDVGFAGKFFKYNDLSKGIRKVNEQVSPILRNYGYRGFFSTEVRTTKDNKHYLIDPCCRLGSPPNEVYQEIYKNLGEIVWGLMQGEVVDPTPVQPYGMEIMIHSDWFQHGHQAIAFPPEIRNNVKLRNMLKIDGKYYMLNLHDIPEAAALVAVGPSLEDCQKQIEKMAPMVKGYGLTVKLEAIPEAIEEFNKMLTDSKK